MSNKKNGAHKGQSKFANKAARVAAKAVCKDPEAVKVSNRLHRREKDRKGKKA